MRNLILFTVSDSPSLSELNEKANQDVEAFSDYMGELPLAVGGPLIDHEKTLIRSYIMWAAQRAIRCTSSVLPPQSSPGPSGAPEDPH